MKRHIFDTTLDVFVRIPHKFDGTWRIGMNFEANALIQIADIVTFVNAHI